jgi:hypothetical protein
MVGGDAGSGLFSSSTMGTAKGGSHSTGGLGGTGQYSGGECSNVNASLMWIVHFSIISHMKPICSCFMCALSAVIRWRRRIRRSVEIVASS